MLVLLALVALFPGQPQPTGPATAPVVVVAADDTKIDRSCTVQIARGSVIRDGNGDGVIHIVADRFEDLTFLLGRLSDNDVELDRIASIDETKRPVISRQRHPRAGGPRLDLGEQVKQFLQGGSRQAGCGRPRHPCRCTGHLRTRHRFAAR